MTTVLKPKILLIEDDVSFAWTLKRHLEFSAMDVSVFTLIQDVWNFFKSPSAHAHIMLLDLHLPGGNGLTLFQQLRAHQVFIPTIFMTGDLDETVRVHTLDNGGDDHLVKPFSLREMVARIHVVLRRSTMCVQQITQAVSLSDKEFHFCGVKVLPAQMKICFLSETVQVGRKEISILAFLAQNPNLVISRKSFIQSIWGHLANEKGRSFDQYITKIRHLFRQHGVSTKCLRTVHSVGYYYALNEGNEKES